VETKYRISVGKIVERNPFGRPRCKREENNQINNGGIKSKDGDRE
jgi:hypothetical protein